MADWIPFAEGSYVIERAWLITPADTAVPMREAVLEVYQDPSGRRHMRGRGLVRNVLIVDLMEDEERIDLVIDLGDAFQFLLEEPLFQAGKVFSRLVESIVHFAPSRPLKKLAPEEYSRLCERMSVQSA